MKEREHSGSGAAGGGTVGRGSAGGRLTPKQREQRSRRQRALELHGEGKTLQEIADELGWSSPSGVAYALKIARREFREIGPVEDREELRRLHFERYEMLLSRYWPLALGGVSNGERVPPSIKHERVVRGIMAAVNELMGLNMSPEEAFERESPAMSVPAASDDEKPVMVIDFDKEGWEAAKRRSAQSARDELIAVDDQPPAGRIAPRPSDDVLGYENGGLEPNSIDPVTGEPIFDPRVAIKRN